VVFTVLLLFAGWFLDPNSPNPARLYISFMMTTTSYLVLLLALFLSTFSLPNDIKNRTIYTVVTKPVRATEIVLGRMLGFSIVGTFLLAAMGVMSYVFVVRGLSHSHAVAIGDLLPDDSGPAGKGASEGHAEAWKGHTRSAQQHRHEMHVDASGHARVEAANGHWHDLTIDKQLLSGSPSAKAATVETGPAEGLFLARVPIYGKLRFQDRDGHEAEKGISVGDEWTYRSYIAGGTLAAAIWSFENVSEKDFPDGLPLELTISIFRTQMGDIVSGIPASLSLRNPATGLKVEAKVFPAKEFVNDVQFVPRKLQAPDGHTLDLYRDLVSEDGRLEIWLQCGAPAQYFGMAQPDLYIRARDGSFAWNFVKGYLGIWLQMELLLAFGVTFSTFLSGPIAMVATLGVLLGGLCSPFIQEVASEKAPGGGPAESMIRLLTQDNVVTPLEPGLRTTFAKMFDKVAEKGFGVLATLLPNFGQLDYSEYLASGFDIDWNTVLIGIFTAIGFAIPVYLAGYFFFKTREVAA
jgi:ABC-type transport system involved in multi-copper enzyme maturation permease subunit